MKQAAVIKCNTQLIQLNTILHAKVLCSMNLEDNHVNR